MHLGVVGLVSTRRCKSRKPVSMAVKRGFELDLRSTRRLSGDIDLHDGDQPINSIDSVRPDSFIVVDADARVR